MSKTHWTAYWNSGVLTSLPADFKENYDGELAGYWRNVLQSMPDKISVLDVCTGNGAVAILLQELADELNQKVEITAVDASDIDPNAVVAKHPSKTDAINRVSFIGNCLVEGMAARINQSFDLIVSQYGIEYCETLEAANNVYELLKHNGKFVFIAHSPNTAMLDHMLIEEQVYQLLEDDKVFYHFEQFSSGKLSVNGFKNKLKQHLQMLSTNETYRQHALVNTWGQNMYQLFQMNNTQLKDQKKQVHQFLKQYIYARARSQDMLNVTNKLLNDQDWFKAFEQVGLTLEHSGELSYQGQHNVGHYYEFVKV